jgi:hypothetical protein
MANKPREKFTELEAREVALKLGIDWAKVDYKLEDFLKGMNVELEHGYVDMNTNITNDDPLLTAKIALAHLNEGGSYYERLERMEREMEHEEEIKELKHGAEGVGMKIKAANRLRESMGIY